jgi:hypothetical protein
VERGLPLLPPTDDGNQFEATAREGDGPRDRGYPKWVKMVIMMTN